MIELILDKACSKLIILLNEILLCLFLFLELRNTFETFVLLSIAISLVSYASHKDVVVLTIIILVILVHFDLSSVEFRFYHVFILQFVGDSKVIVMIGSLLRSLINMMKSLILIIWAIILKNLFERTIIS